MREPFRDRGRLEHMLEMAHCVCNARSRYTYEEIMNDKLLFYGLTKMIEIIGEAAYKLTHEFRSVHTELPWKEIIGMRHLLVHGYYTISPEVLWDVIQNDIPPMTPIIERYIKELGD